MPVPTTNHDWLSLTVEEPLDPDLPICDPHHHLWDHVTGRVAGPYVRICVDRPIDHIAEGIERLARAWRDLSTLGAIGRQRAHRHHVPTPNPRNPCGPVHAPDLT